MRSLLALVALVGCADADLGPAPEASGASAAAAPAEPPLVGTVWRLTSLGGEPPAEGVRPALIFTEASGALDLYDRPRGPEWADALLLRGESGVGPLHEPYVLEGDSVRIGAAYAYTRVSPEASASQAQRLVDALAAARRLRRGGDRLALLGPASDTLARFTADPPRTPGPLDDIEWVATRVDGRAVGDSVRMTLGFSSSPLGPGPDDGYDQVGGYDGCNWYGGGYRLLASGADPALGADREAGPWTLEHNGPFVATARGCRPEVMELSMAFSAALFQSRTVRREGNRLALADSAGAVRLVFRRHEPYAVDLAALRRGRWRYASQDNPYAPDGAGAVLTFGDSTFTGRNGCEGVRGLYLTDGDNFMVPETFGEGTCAPGETPRHIPITRGKLSVSRDTLAMYDEDGRRTVYVR